MGGQGCLRTLAAAKQPTKGPGHDKEHRRNLAVPERTTGTHGGHGNPIDCLRAIALRRACICSSAGGWKQCKTGRPAEQKCGRCVHFCLPKSFNSAATAALAASVAVADRAVAPAAFLITRSASGSLIPGLNRHSAAQPALMRATATEASAAATSGLLGTKATTVTSPPEHVTRIMARRGSVMSRPMRYIIRSTLHLLSLGLDWICPQNRPGDVWAQVFAAHQAACSGFYVWAAFCWYPVFPGKPLANSRFGHTQNSG